MAERFVAAQGDVVWTTNTGHVEADIEGLRRRHNEAVGSMSTAALRATSAQAQLDRALAKHGPTSTQAIRAEINYRNAVRTSTTEVGRHERAIRDDERTLGRAARGAAVGSGAFRGLGRSVAFASTGFLGGAGLTYAIKSSVDAASNLNEQTSKTKAVFDDAAPSVLAWSRTTTSAIGLASDQALEAASTYGLLFRNVGEGSESASKLSRSLVQLAADLASFNNTSVDDALAAIRSGLTGEIEPLRRYGVFLSEARTKQLALADSGKKNAGQLTTGEKVLARYHLVLKDTARAQGDYARTADQLANSQRTFQAEMRETEILVGNALLPTLKDLFNSGNDYLEQQRRTGKLQREIRHDAHELGQALQGVEDTVKIGVRLFGKLNDVTGGTRHSFELLAGVFILKKLGFLSLAAKGVSAAVGGVGASAVAAEATTAKATTAMVAEWDAVAGAAGRAGAAGAAAGGAAGAAGGAGFSKKTLAAALVRGGVSYLVAQQIVDTLQPGTGFDFSSPSSAQSGPGKPGSGRQTSYRMVYRGEGKYSDVRVYFNPADKGYYIGFVRGGKTGQLFGPYKSENAALYAFGITTGYAQQQTDVATGGYGGGDTGPKTKPPKKKPKPATTIPVDLQIAYAQAQLTASTSDDLKALQAESDFIKKALQDKRLTKAQRLQLLQDEQQVDAQIQQIRDQRAQARAAAAAKEAAAAKARAKAARDRIKARHDAYRAELALDERRLQNARTKAELTTTLADDKRANANLIAFYRKESHDQRLTRAEREAYVSKELAAEKAARAKAKKTGTGADFFTEAANQERLYGSNIAPRGGVLSGQDERALLGQLITLTREGNQHAAKTARHTGTAATRRATSIDDARLAATHGY